MRVCYILLMAAATLFANSNAASAVTTADQKKLTNVVSGDLVQSTNEQVGGNGKRFLRSHKEDGKLGKKRYSPSTIWDKLNVDKYPEYRKIYDKFYAY
ncbi:hypothetical protein BBP00_00010013 [Phytophthora kernoviae]|uniref:RxLR effector protein n=1 Tax=Phytophthora kernoviae TaxID=325452 RepID=A0A3F2RAX4_9STRA|nr:hypothetical protein BBP00_00010013 [Phytophthora kernoviae]